MKTHICKPIDYCLCSPIAFEPSERCPIHVGGFVTWPPKCATCGRFVKQNEKILPRAAQSRDNSGASDGNRLGGKDGRGDERHIDRAAMSHKDGENYG